MNPPHDSPLLTIVTVARNDLYQLRRTKASVEAQRTANYEHLIVDGASTDGSVQWLSTLAHPNFRWISESDLGIFDAMNKGAGLAHGELVLFLNAGDRFNDPGVVSRILESYLTRKWEWSYARARVVDEHGLATRPEYGLRKYRGFVHAYARSAICHQTVAMRREFFLALGGFDLSHGLVADYALLLKAGRIAPPFVRATVDVHYLDGGVSAINARPAWAKHVARVDVLTLRKVQAAGDAVFAQMQDGWIGVRRRLKRRAMSTKLGRGFVRVWARDR